MTVAGGVATPLDFDAVFPLNPTATVAFGKWFTPAVGVEVEGTGWFGSHVFKGSATRFDGNGNSHNFIRGSYVGLNGNFNLSNIIAGYMGSPRNFEVGATLGTGWIHTFIPNSADTIRNHLGVKTALDFSWNFGKAKEHTVSIRPAVLWNMNNPNTNLKFNCHHAQAQIAIAYTYHFKTSNGTHHFKEYDVGAILEDNEYLKAELEKKPKEVVKVVKEYVDVVKEPETPKTVIKDLAVFFAQNSSELTDDAKSALDVITENTTVEIKGTASPEGSLKYNQKLSEKRAAVVKEYLTSRNVNVIDAKGIGVQNSTSNRTAIITIK